jgi:hypothetical protein
MLMSLAGTISPQFGQAICRDAIEQVLHYAPSNMVHNFHGRIIVEAIFPAMDESLQ